MKHIIDAIISVYIMIAIGVGFSWPLWVWLITE